MIISKIDTMGRAYYESLKKIMLVHVDFLLITIDKIFNMFLLEFTLQPNHDTSDSHRNRAQRACAAHQPGFRP